MLFNSIDFVFFLPTVFLLYWFVANRSAKIQNGFLLGVSYLFYGWWDWRFLSLIVVSSLVDYLVGLGLSQTDERKTRMLLLLASVLVNLGMLGFFKYYHFFLENFVQAYRFFGQPIDPQGLEIILPVGISFYTFQTLSYSIDAYRRKLEPTRDLVAFFAFVAFFPQLVAGPIERATNLLTQFYTKREFEYQKATDGMRQILWGFFKKVVIADNCARYVELIFNDPTSYSGSTLLLGAIFFAFQIYGDFSGYSDIAIGTARLFGFDLMQNFAFPYFSRDIAEFWRRWHISLSTWFRDYLYIPLGGSRGGAWVKIRNTFIIFVISGFWHGADWTFILWGVVNALFFLPYLLLNRNRRNLGSVAKGKFIPTALELLAMLLTFTLTTFAWIIFRAESVPHALAYIKGIFQLSLFSLPTIRPTTVAIFVILFVLVEWLQREQRHGLDFSQRNLATPVRWGLYLLITCFVAAFFGQGNTFIYFQF
ncbi:MAG: MBOAT family O-acyltransferase [Chloroflexota bacterium]